MKTTLEQPPLYVQYADAILRRDAIYAEFKRTGNGFMEYIEADQEVARLRDIAQRQNAEREGM